MVANRQATLELLLHDGILRDETGRKAGDANFLDAQGTIASCRGTPCLGAGADALGQIQFSRSMACGSGLGRARFLLHDYLGRGNARTANRNIKSVICAQGPTQQLGSSGLRAESRYRGDTYALGGEDLAAAGIVLLGLMLPDRSCVGAGAITAAKEASGAIRCIEGEGSDGLEEDAGRSAPNDGRS